MDLLENEKTYIHDSVALSGTSKTPFVHSLYFRVLVGIVAGIAVGVLFPHFGAMLKPLGDGFIKLIRMLVAPIIFFSVVGGISSIGDLRKLGRIGLKALFYFEMVTTLAFLIGIASAKLIQPGRGMNIDPAALDIQSVEEYAVAGKHLGIVDFLLNIIPDTFVSAFAKGEVLQVLLLAILVGMALLMMEEEQHLVASVRSLSALFFKIIAITMELAPLAAFGSLAFTIGRYGIASLVPLGKVLCCVYLTCIVFTVVVLGTICYANGVNLLKLIRLLKEELLIVFATSSSEPALPRLIMKMEGLGCSAAVSGLVIPAGYSFNLDGTSIYLSVAALFIAQATNTHLSIRQQVFLFIMLLLNSKGAAAVTGGGFITLAATLAAVGSIPVAGITLLLGIDRFMSEMRSLVNLIGNAVATIVVARWEKQFDEKLARLVLDGDLIVNADRFTSQPPECTAADFVAAERK
jgi:aerobic C4-dicarboxylate transport protein